MTPQADTREAVQLPEPKYLAKLSRDGEWAELAPATDWTVEMWAWGTEYVYSADQVRTIATALATADAECERLRGEIDSISDTMHWMNDRATAAEARAAEVEANDRRYRWLRDVANNLNTPAPVVYSHAWYEQRKRGDAQIIDGDNLDAAIDAALKDHP